MLFSAVWNFCFSTQLFKNPSPVQDWIKSVISSIPDDSDVHQQSIHQRIIHQLYSLTVFIDKSITTIIRWSKYSLIDLYLHLNLCELDNGCTYYHWFSSKCKSTSQNVILNHHFIYQQTNHHYCQVINPNNESSLRNYSVVILPPVDLLYCTVYFHNWLSFSPIIDTQDGRVSMITIILQSIAVHLNVPNIYLMITLLYPTDQSQWTHSGRHHHNHPQMIVLNKSNHLWIDQIGTIHF